jgi:hypothetical protein
MDFFGAFLSFLFGGFGGLISFAGASPINAGATPINAGATPINAGASPIH